MTKLLIWLPGNAKARASVKLVDPMRLSEAVARYIDYEGLAYWVRPALERGSELPPEVVLELDRRLPRYLQAAPEPRAKKQIGAPRDWENGSHLCHSPVNCPVRHKWEIILFSNGFLLRLERLVSLFIDKVRDLVGLYLNPPDRALVCR